MIPAAQDLFSSCIWLILVDERVCSMAADIVKRMDLSLLVLDQEEVESSYVKSQIAPRIWEAYAMGSQQPLF